ncbi:MAG TPA: hypothetical protein VM778_07085 [Gemmatimonadota bacterium]|nr:hypothetical protein [Gemmatimonadota bacterium]
MTGWSMLAVVGLGAVTACQPAAEATVAECRRLVEEDPDAAHEMMDVMYAAMAGDSMMGEHMIGRMMDQPRMRSMMTRHMMGDPDTRDRMMEMMGGGAMGPGTMGPGGGMGPGMMGAPDTAGPR